MAEMEKIEFLSDLQKAGLTKLLWTEDLSLNELIDFLIHYRKETALIETAPMA